MSRKTDRNATKQGTTIGFPLAKACYWKLKEIEDVLEDFGVENVEELEKRLLSLEAFKNSLTIQKDDAYVFPSVKVDEHDHVGDVVAYYTGQIVKIEQNKLDINVKNQLKDWIIRNFFADENEILKALKDMLKGGEIYFTTCREDNYMDIAIVKNVFIQDMRIAMPHALAEVFKRWLDMK